MARGNTTPTEVHSWLTDIEKKIADAGKVTVSSTPPESKNDMWIHNGVLKYYNKNTGQWTVQNL